MPSMSSPLDLIARIGAVATLAVAAVAGSKQGSPNWMFMQEAQAEIRRDGLDGLERMKDRWLSDGHEGPIDLSGIDLSAARLEGADLERAILRDAILIDTNLSRARLGYADLRGANLTSTTLNRANLSGARFTGAIMRLVSAKNALFSDAKLNSVNLGGADLTGADLSGADFTESVLAGANLNDANAMQANFHRANLQDTRLAGTQFQGARLDQPWRLQRRLPYHVVVEYLQGARFDAATTWPAGFTEEDAVMGGATPEHRRVASAGKGHWWRPSGV